MPPEMDATISGDDWFANMDEDPAGNADATPTGDLDSEADLYVPESAEEVEGDDDPGEALEGAEDGPEGVEDADNDWLPGFEGRFRVGEEAKALAAYNELEKAYSRKDEETRRLIAEERQQALREFQELTKAPEPQQSWQDQIQVRGQLAALALDDPAGAFKHALESGDETLINTVIDTVSNGDPEIDVPPNPGAALQMLRAVQEAQTRAALDQQRIEIQSMRAERNAEVGGTRFQGEYANELAIPEVQAEFARIAESRRSMLDASSPDGVYTFLAECMDTAVGRLARTGQLPQPAQEQAPAPVQKVDPHAHKRQARLEGGGVTKTRAPQQAAPTVGDTYGDDLLAAAREMRPNY